MEKIIAVVVLIAIGGFMLLFTHTMILFQIWSNRVIVGAQYVPSKRTYMAMRILGIFLIIVGILVGILK